MVRENDGCPVADFKVFRRDGNACPAQRFHFAPERLKVDHSAVAKHVNDARAEDARGNEMQGKFAIFVDHGVARIVSALIAAYDIAFFGEKIDHAAFSFVAPVNSDNSCKHKFISPIDFYCPPKKSTNYYSTVSLVCKDGFEKNLKNCEKYAFGSCPVLTYRGKYDKLYKETVIYAA